MPDVIRVPIRMECTGIDLVHPIDREPVGSFPYLFNARVIEEGIIDGRPGYTPSLELLDPPNSVRRLNDSTGLAIPGYIYIGGGGAKLYAGIEGVGNYNPIDSGYSGDPLSLIPFRPDQSPQSWMYVYDRLKSLKVRPDGVIQQIGAIPPTIAPLLDYGKPAWVQINKGNSATGWAATGTVAGPPTVADRTNGSAGTIGNILYNDGNTGWACMQPTGVSLTTGWIGERMEIVLASGTGNEETVVVREIHSPIPDPTLPFPAVESVMYDSGTDGMCSMVIAGSPGGLARNSMLDVGTGMGSELLRVLEVVPSPDGQSYSIRVFTVLSHTPGEPVVGVLSLYIWTNLPHLPSETIVSQYLASAIPGAGTGGVALLVTEDASKADGRFISPSDDYLHISVFLQDPKSVTKINIYVDIDGVTGSLGSAFKGNYYTWVVTQAELVSLGTSGVQNTWTEIIVPISSGTRSGADFTRNFSTVKAIKVEVEAMAATNFGFDDWYFFGTYGPTIQPNSPVGYIYATRFRNSGTGVASVPSPFARYQVFPLREAVTVTPQVSTQVGIDEIDIYRQGGTIPSPLYVGTVVNDPPTVYIDSLPDSYVLQTNQAPDLGAIQPWPILIPPLSGLVNVVGTSIQWISPPQDKFPLSMLSGTVILINGQAFRTYGQPRTQEFLELTQDAGSLINAKFQIASPTLAGQPLPFAFGPLEGPFAPVIFGLGDQNNPGLLYYTNSANADTASDANTVELSTPSSGLVSGAVWNGLAFAGSRDQIYCVRYSFLSGIGQNNGLTYQFQKVPCPSGIWSMWACCACPIGVAYLGRDGIYIATDTTAVSITDEKLYPLFPHDGQVAGLINSGSNIIAPVDMTQTQHLRLTYCDEELRFTYRDTAGNFQTLIYEIYKKRWFLNNYANHITMHYLIEQPYVGGLNDEAILMLAEDANTIMKSGGFQDDGIDIHTVVLTPSYDSGDERAQKLYVDAMMQASGTGDMQWAATFDNAQTFSPPVTVTTAVGIQQYLQNIASLADLSLYRNIGAKISWTGGPAGPRLYAWEMSGFLQPYLSAFFVTQFIPFSFPGWKHMRRMFPALISNSPILMTIKLQDGRTFGPYTIPSTGGQYRILPQMLDHGIKDLAFALQLDGQGKKFAFFPQDFTVEVKQWTEETYIDLAVFRA